jgi:hypothetical protein
MVVFYVWRWRGSSGWRVDSWDADDPAGYSTEAEALARVEQLLAIHRRSRRKEMYPPPIAYPTAPRMAPRKKEQRHRFTPQELNGYIHERSLLQEARR